MRKFKTESKKLLDLMINSIYTNKEIFLRELISNASDAMDKLYFMSLTDPNTRVAKDELRIRVSFDKEARTVTISDSGVGMDKDELEKNLGTIAHSGSFDFKSESGDEQNDDIDIIGQFGVGFYSAFMVSDGVKVITKKYGTGQAYVWESCSIEGYTIEEAEKDAYGTDVILTIREDAGDEKYDTYLSEQGLKNLIRKYSNYVRYPIEMECTERRALPKPEDAGDDYQTQYEEYAELKTINSMTPIWKHKKSEVSQEEYDEFYKDNFHDFTDPVRTISIHAEGSFSFDALLFIPGRAPYDLYSKEFKKGLALYSSGVMIMEKCEDLLPDCFNFVRGVVDSEDLSLNISRETLQQDSQLRAIARRIEKKIKAELVDMRDNDREGYEKVFENFGRGMKYGIYSSYGAQEDLLGDLLLFYSAREKKMITLDEYVSAVSEDQKSIFYAAGESNDRLSKMSIVEFVLGKGHDVLFCTQDVDEFCLTAMNQYAEKDLRNVAGGDLGLDSEDEKSAAKVVAEENGDLLAAMKDALGDRVAKVAVSTRLTDAPACITTQGPISLEMEKMFASAPGADGVKSERVLEINAGHPIFETLKGAEEAGDTEKVERYTDILYNQALLVEGMPIEDPVAFTRSVCELMK